MSAANDLIARFQAYVIDPVLVVLFTAGFFLFMWGFVEFLWTLNKGGKRDVGKDHMIWGIAGMFIMVTVYGIIALIYTTFGFSSADTSTLISGTPQNWFVQK